MKVQLEALALWPRCTAVDLRSGGALGSGGSATRAERAGGHLRGVCTGLGFREGTVYIAYPKPREKHIFGR